MTPKLLRTFLTVARTGNMSVAAGRLNLAQSSVSDQVQLLETQLGATLFERGRNGLTLTAAGETLKPYAEAILATIDEATAALVQEREGRPATLALGALETIAAQWLPARLSRFRQAHPGIDLRLEIASSGELLRRVKEGSLDAAFCFDASELDPALARRTVAREPLALIGRTGAEDGQQASGFVATRPGCAFRRIFDANVAALPQRGARIVAEVDSIATIVNFVANGDALALVPRLAAAEGLRRGEVAEIAPIPATLFATLSLVWRRRRVQPLALRHLLGSLGSGQPVATVAM